MDIFSNKFSYDTFLAKYSMNQVESWENTCKRVVEAVTGRYLSMEDQQAIFEIMKAREFIPGGRYLYSAGRPYHNVNNCFLFRVGDSREGWAESIYNATMALTSGGGIGFDYSAVRPNGSTISRTGGIATGPLAWMNAINEVGRQIVNGGNRRSAIWAGLQWDHGDVKDFLTMKNHSKELLALKEKDLEFPIPMEGTNISVIYNTEFFIAVADRQHPKHKLAKEVWDTNCKQAFSTAEPGMSFNFCKDNESLRNACAEVVSEDDSDKCNLGTVWVNRIKDKDRLAFVVKHATQFLLCGGLYSNLPTDKIREVGATNNRIGLGLGGIHEWLMQRKEPYWVTPELHKWLRIYEQESDAAAFIYSRELGVPMPKGRRAIAPNGTIGILSETTTGIEPLFCKAYKRRYKGSDNQWKHQFVVDGAVKRLEKHGVPLENIQDAYDISFKDRVKFQADVQNYVDMAISSTCNLPQWGSDDNNETNYKVKAKTLLKYAKRLRGFTAYPDGCRSGQPLERVSLEDAMEAEGKVFEEREDECVGGVCGL